MAARTGEVCAKCKERPRKPGQSYCKECHAEYMVEWRSRGVTLTRKTLKKLGLQSIRQ